MNFLEKQLEDPVRFARIKRWFYGGLILVVLAEIFMPLIFHLLKITCKALNLPTLAKSFHLVEHPHFWFESFPLGSYFPKLPWGSFYGLFSCVVIILVSKFLGKVWLMRGEDYYD